MSADDLSITEDLSDPEICRLILNGRITAVSSNNLSEKLTEAHKGFNSIILDMEKVSFLTSSGIRVLLMYFKIMKGKGGRFLIQNPSENVSNVLSMVALNEMLLI